MLFFVRTLTMTHDDFILRASYFHWMAPIANERRIRLKLVGKQIKITLRRNCPSSSVGDRWTMRFRKRQSPYDMQRRPNVNLNRGNVTPTSSTNLPLTGNVIAKEERSNGPIVPQMVALPSPDDVSDNIQSDQQSLPPQDIPVGLLELAAEATAQQTAQWLQAHRFSAYLRIFASFSGADILRSSRDDLIQICGLADGIRLYNALHSRSIVPQLTVYLCVEQASVYHALYLASLSSIELGTKLAQLLGVSTNQIHDVYVQGPAGIHVLLTDDVVRNIKDEAMYTIEILQDQSGERYRLLLKPANQQ